MIREYKYPFSFKLINGLIVVSVAVGLVISLVLTITFESFIKDVVSLVILIFCAIVILMVAIMFPDIRVFDKGIEIKFLFRYLHVPWNEVISIKNGGFGLRHINIVSVKELTLLHKILACAYGEFDYPVFLIHSNIQNHLSILGEIENRISKNV